MPPQILRSVNANAVDKAPTSFALRFYSTLPSTTENSLKVSLGQLPKSEIVPDRVFNTRSVLDAYYGQLCCWVCLCLDGRRRGMASRL